MTPAEKAVLTEKRVAEARELLARGIPICSLHFFDSLRPEGKSAFSCLGGKIYGPEVFAEIPTVELAVLPAIHAKLPKAAARIATHAQFMSWSHRQRSDFSCAGGRIVA